ncbi:intracellular short-chain-length polyhydroxyalkanoate depolymerase [Paenibacillus sp. 481]|uniref:intracellular short-chain-length polyhydroxyalkanoate depolymerase n=1 Tax=Paenibacillus sp. 481 TaxID=2835869 RepID=UPI001E4B3242|nr:alpha/beta hydrolase [Paenibacillus sp. 481]UHA74617.1 alpha/beta hydrolase [Paenibacillus sp. 481]
MQAKIHLKSVQLPNGEMLGYRERDGGDELVLLIHGNMNSSCHWDLVFEQLDPRYKLIAVDLRGFGISTYHQPIRSLHEFAEDVKQFTDALHMQRYAVVGWSTGGGVAMHLAADYPEQVEKLILLAPVSTRGYPFYEDGSDGLPDVTKRVTTFEQIASLKRNQAIAEANLRADGAYMRQIYNAVIYTHKKPAAARYEKYINDILTQRNLLDVYTALNTFNISEVHNEAAKGSAAVQRITAPVLLLRGDRDLVISEQMMNDTRADFEGRANYVILQNCGHSPLVDDLRQLLAVMESFLSEPSSS